MGKAGLIGAVFALALLTAPPGRASNESAAEPFTLQAVGPGVYAAIDGPKHRAGSNAGFVIGDDGVLVFDAFQSPEAAEALVARIHAITPQPIRYLVNSHYHLDHTGGDAVLRQAGAILVTHDNFRGWVRVENVHLLGGAVTPQRKAQIESLPLPDVTTRTGLTLWLGARRIEVTAYPGHTGGDLIAQVPDAHVVFAGDLLWRRTSPNVIDGTVKDWIATVTALLALPGAGGTAFVPGHGAVADASDVRDFRDYLAALRDATMTARDRGLSGPALVATVQPQLKARFGDWDLFDYFAPKEIGFMEAELAGTKRIPKPGEP